MAARGVLLVSEVLFLFFLRKEKEKNGGAKTQVGFRPPVNFSVICFASDTYYFPEVSGWRSSPKKNTATVPGPEWDATMVPMSQMRILPFR